MKMEAEIGPTLPLLGRTGGRRRARAAKDVDAANRL